MHLAFIQLFRLPPSSIFALLFLLFSRSANAQFRDVSRQVGIRYDEGPGSKYGGPSIADLDGNGCPDLIFAHHTRGPAMEIYFNQCNGTFARSPFRKNHDIHAITPVRLHASHKSLHFIVSLGGQNGHNPSPPTLIRVGEDASVVDVTQSSSLSKLRQRGRGGLSMELHLRKPWKQTGRADVLLSSARIKGVRSPHAGLTTISSKRFRRRYVSGDFHRVNPTFIAPIDARSDGRMNILSLRECHVFQVTAGFKLMDITKSVFPNWNPKDPLHAVSAMAEADFNNDGRWDLYLARSVTGSLDFLRASNSGVNVSDILMFGTRDRKYLDVSRAAGIPRYTETRGVTTGDFNNDGFVDILLIMYTGRDMLYMNKGDGTFRRRPAPWFKRGAAYGDMATAVDYDGDGRLDVVLSEGAWSGRNHRGYYRVMKNFWPRFDRDRRGRRRQRRFLLVRVGSSPRNRASSMHAVVRVVAGNLKMIRRVGAPGVAVSVSYIELVHFGLGFARKVKFVKVTWTDGSSVTRWNIKSNSRITIGRV